MTEGWGGSWADENGKQPEGISSEGGTSMTDKVTPTQADRDAATDFATRYLYPNCQGVRSVLATAFADHAEQARREQREQAAVIAEAWGEGRPELGNHPACIAQAIRAAKEQ